MLKKGELSKDPQLQPIIDRFKTRAFLQPARHFNFYIEHRERFIFIFARALSLARSLCWILKSDKLGLEPLLFHLL